eukprot:scaffold4859_cov128-Isochrysis_galbana.AAC.5
MGQTQNKTIGEKAWISTAGADAQTRHRRLIDAQTTATRPQPAASSQTLSTEYCTECAETVHYRHRHTDTQTQTPTQTQNQTHLTQTKTERGDS